jgi:hypothetical protein
MSQRHRPYFSRVALTFDVISVGFTETDQVLQKLIFPVYLLFVLSSIQLL